jgi:hypothetical protein
MRIAIGNNPFWKLLSYDNEISRYFIVYPAFYDNLKALINKKYENYIRQLWRKRKIIKYALYPDYIRKIIPLPKSITYIYPVHSLNEVDFINRLKKEYSIIAGYCSNPKLRDYNLKEFIQIFPSIRWYLGISTMKELREAIKYNFEYCDITLMLLGRFSDIKRYSYVKEKLRELFALINHPKLIQ